MDSKTKHSNLFATQAKLRRQIAKRMYNASQFVSKGHKYGKVFGAATLGAATAVSFTSFVNDVHAEVIDVQSSCSLTPCPAGNNCTH
jgi:esterase/lipase superfamily enzyme